MQEIYFIHIIASLAMMWMANMEHIRGEVEGMIVLRRCAVALFIVTLILTPVIPVTLATFISSIVYGVVIGILWPFATETTQ